MHFSIPFIIIITLLPTCIWGFMYYKHEPEPLHVLIRTWIAGIYAALILMMYQWFVINKTGISLLDVLEAKNTSLTISILLFSLMEEFIKGGLLIFFILTHKEYIDKRVDGIIYGMSLALGFAFVENVIYFATMFPLLSETNILVTYLFRTGGTMFAHTLFTGIFGYFIVYGLLDVSKDQHFFSQTNGLFFRFAHFIREIITFHTLRHHILPQRPSQKGHYFWSFVIEALILSTLLHFIFNILLTTSIVKRDHMFVIIPGLFLLGSYVFKKFHDKKATEHIHLT